MARTQLTARFELLRAERVAVRDSIFARVAGAYRTISVTQQERHNSIPWQPDDMAAACAVCKAKVSKCGASVRCMCALFTHRGMARLPALTSPRLSHRLLSHTCALMQARHDRAATPPLSVRQ